MDDKSEMDFEISDRRRTLRSSTGHAKQATATTSTSKATSTTVPPYKVDSDSDDGGLYKSYLDELARPSASTSNQKQTTSVPRNRVYSEKEFEEVGETSKGETSGKPVKTQTSSNERVTSNVGLKDDGEVETTEHGISDQGASLLGADSSDIQSNTVDSSAGMQENDIKNSGNDQTKLDGETLTGQGEDLLESKKSEDEVRLMDTNQENQAEFIRRPKRKSVLQPVIADDSTDDESEFTQPVFSVRYPGQDSSVGCEVPDSGEDKGTANDQDSLASQSLTQENESQSIVGKSILEAFVADNDEPIPSQTLFESDGTSNKTMVENLEEDTCDTAETSPLAVSSSVNQAEQRIVDEEKLVVDVDSSESQQGRRLRSEKAEKAAAAAERRQWMQSRRDMREACSSRYI